MRHARLYCYCSGSGRHIEVTSLALCVYFIAFWYCEVEGNISTSSLFVTPDIPGHVADENTSLMNLYWGARALERI